jgi:hypothetical protein
MEEAQSEQLSFVGLGRLDISFESVSNWVDILFSISFLVFDSEMEIEIMIITGIKIIASNMHITLL